MAKSTVVAKHQIQPAGLLPVLRALARDRRDFDLTKLAPSVTQAAVRNGLGPVLAYISRDCPASKTAALAGEIRAADLTAQMLTADIIDATGHMLRGTSSEACRPLLLKGAAMALREYPTPHLRTMGDIDICVPRAHQLTLEAQLRTLGFEQTSERSAESFERHHHSMPFWHSKWQVWVEVHTRLFPPRSLLSDNSRFTLDGMESELRTVEMLGVPVRVMTDELQLLYTCTRWLEDVNIERGIFPVLDVVILLRNHGDALDWERVFAMLEESPSVATTAVRTMLAYLDLNEIIPVPREILRRLAANDRYTNSVSQWILHHIVTIFLIERRPYGRFLTEHNVDLIWATLLQTPAPITNLLSLPYRIAFPPGHVHRFSLANAARRLSSLIHGPTQASRDRTPPQAPL